MSAPKWTAGPWEVNPKTPQTVITPDGMISVSWFSTDGHYQRLAEATAHLIAAAPEMYEALERIRYECDNDLSGLAKLFIDATLAKARGES